MWAIISNTCDHVIALLVLGLWPWRLLMEMIDLMAFVCGLLQASPPPHTHILLVESNFVLSIVLSFQTPESVR
jgi:hypothetical protein